MPILPLLNAVPVLPIDTTKTSTFFSKLASASDLSAEQLIQQMISGLVQVSIKILIAVVIALAGRWIIKRIHKFIRKVLERRNVELSLRTFLLSLVNISLMLILIVTVIGVLGINTSSFVALFASAGIAVGMALSGTLQNFAGGVMVLLFKPYKVGDFIEAQGQTGTVKEIQIFNTVLNTPDNKTIIIPNGGISTGIINNYSKEGVRRVDWTFGIAYGDDYDKAKEVLAEMLDNDKRVLETPAYFIALSSLSDSSVLIVVRAWVNAEEYWNVHFDINECVYKEFGKHQINFPFPQMDVHLFSPKA